MFSFLSFFFFSVYDIYVYFSPDTYLTASKVNEIEREKEGKEVLHWLVSGSGSGSVCLSGNRRERNYTKKGDGPLSRGPLFFCITVF